MFFSLSVYSQHNNVLKPSDTLNSKRRNTVVITQSAVGGLTLLALNQLWYADYQRLKFHTIDDNSEWLQMDKLGHVFSAYQLGKLGAQSLRWSGVSEKISYRMEQL